MNWYSLAKALMCCQIEEKSQGTRVVRFLKSLYSNGLKTYVKKHHRRSKLKVIQAKRIAHYKTPRESPEGGVGWGKCIARSAVAALLWTDITQSPK